MFGRFGGLGGPAGVNNTPPQRSHTVPVWRRFRWDTVFTWAVLITMLGI